MLRKDNIEFTDIAYISHTGHNIGVTCVVNIQTNFIEPNQPIRKWVTSAANIKK